MTVERKSAQEFQAEIRQGILDSTSEHETAFGPLADVVTVPMAGVLEEFNNYRLRPVSLLASLDNADEISEDDLNAIAFNEEIIRPDGSYATAALTLQRDTQFSAESSGLVSRGTPIGTAVDQSSGQVVTFVTTESVDKTTAVAVIDTDLDQTVYRTTVGAVCLVAGPQGKVGTRRISRPLRSLNGWDRVFNELPAQLGHDRMTNEELVELTRLAVSSRQLGTATGSEFSTRDNFVGVEDIREVFGTDPLLTRASTDAGAVDVYIKGQNLVSKTDQVTYLGVGQKYIVTTPPVVSISTVTRVSTGVIYLEGVDYEVSLDTSGVASSTRARDGIRFLPTATSTLPSNGDAVAITYQYNQLIRDLQANESDREVQVRGQDKLHRMGTEVVLYVSAVLTVRSGFTFNRIRTLVIQALIDAVEELGLARDDVEASDIQKTVRRLSGVDNFVITKLARTASSTGTADIVLARNEYPTLTTDNIAISGS